MKSTTQVLINSVRKASKFLQRDFYELEMLQTSTRGTLEFCNKSYQRTKTNLSEELKRLSEVIIFSDEKFIIPNNALEVLLINPIDSMTNLSRSIPFFGMTITYLRKINQELMPFCSLIYFPITGDFYYANNGGGAWIDQSALTITTRLRVSSQSILENAIIATDDYTQNLFNLTNRPMATGVDSSNGCNISMFGSPSYNIALFASGKVDALYFNHDLDPATKFALELITKECGGTILPTPNNKILVSNYNLIEKFKQLLAQNLI